MNASLWSVTKSEWIKFRTVRSSIMGVIIFALLTLGLGLLVTITIRTHYEQMNTVRKAVFDPVATSLVGILFAQFAVGAVGVMVITSEYSSGAIRTTLAAVPQRGRLIASKVIVLGASMLVVCEVVVFAAFVVGQAIYSGVVPTASLSNSTVLRAVIFAGLYLTLLSVFGFALGLLLRSTAAAIVTYAVVLLIIPIIFAFLPSSWQNDGQRFLPSNLGQSMMSVSTPSQSFSAVTSLVILVLYTVLFVAVGTLIMQRRDA